MRCPICVTPRRMVSVKIDMAGSPVTMHSCSACETRWWERDGHPVHLADILGSARAEVSQGA